MRKFIFVVLCFMMMSTYVYSQSPIDFTVDIIDDMPLGHGQPKSPMRPPVVYIEDYVLTFMTDHPEYIINIKDEDGEIVYSTVVTSAETLITLPSTLSGDYVIELTMGNWKFTGWIEL